MPPTVLVPAALALVAVAMAVVELVSRHVRSPRQRPMRDPLLRAGRDRLAGWSVAAALVLSAAALAGMTWPRSIAAVLLLLVAASGWLGAAESREGRARSILVPAALLAATLAAVLSIAPLDLIGAHIAARAITVIAVVTALGALASALLAWRRVPGAGAAQRIGLLGTLALCTVVGIHGVGL